MSLEEIREKLVEKKMKVTPQRLAVLEAVYKIPNHPTAEQVIEYIRPSHPSIATGTVYKVLDALVANDLIRKVKSDRDIMRYDGVMDHHHHLYCKECDLIEDYVDEELDELLKKYFERKRFEGFRINDIVLQIRGTFDKC